jgi:transposase
MSTAFPLVPDPATLPEDPAILKPLILQLYEALQQERRDRERLEHHLDLLLRKLYGRRSEKWDPRQGALFDVSDAVGDEKAEKPATPQPPTASPANRTPHGRGRIPDTLQRVEQIHDLTEAEKEALGGEDNLVLIGEERSEQVDWKPSSLFVTVHVRKKYARREQLPESGITWAEQNVVVAAKPLEVIPGGLAGPGLLAQVNVSKHTDHLPLYRLEGIFERLGYKISRQTLDGWVLVSAEFLTPLWRLMKEVVLDSLVIHTDDTQVRVRDAWKKLKYTGRFWTYVGDERHPLTMFDYTPNHSRDGPASFLQTFHGYLQADAFSVYDGIFTGSNGAIIEVGCWAHARRKYFDHRRVDPSHAEVALAWIGKLFAIEKELREHFAEAGKDLPWEERYARIAAVRQEQSRPLLESFHQWLETEAPKLLPKNPIRQAMDYTLGNWTALTRYVEHGALDIDNNTAENALRGICLGRKNWLFCGNDRGGRAAAVHFSFLASCKRHSLDPFVYLRDLFIRLPKILPTATPDELRAFLPDRWKPAP